MLYVYCLALMSKFNTFFFMIHTTKKRSFIFSGSPKLKNFKNGSYLEKFGYFWMIRGLTAGTGIEPKRTVSVTGVSTYKKWKIDIQLEPLDFRSFESVPNRNFWKKSQERKRNYFFPKVGTSSVQNLGKPNFSSTSDTLIRLLNIFKFSVCKAYIFGVANI